MRLLTSEWLSHTHQERERERTEGSSLVVFVTVFFKQFVATQKFLWATVYIEEVGRHTYVSSNHGQL